jgi:hypothetical protein
MNPDKFDTEILRYATGWDAAVVPRSIIALFGALVLLLTLRVIWKRNCGVPAALLWLIVGAASLTFACIPQQIVNSVMRSEYLLRLRVVMGGLSLLVLLITLESIRKTRLQERYALLWVATALAILLCALFPQAVNLFRAVTGMQYGTAVAAVAFTFLVLVAFHFSISMSAMEIDRDKIAQKVALLEFRLKELETKLAEKK